MKNKLIPFLTLVLIISCGGGGGGGGSDALVVPTVSISADNPKRYLGYSVNGNISWSISNADSCTGSDGLSGVTISGGSGGASYGFMATETGSFTFTITCTASGGSRSASVTIDVYEYKRNRDVVSNKTWDALGAGILAEFNTSNRLSFIDYSGINNYDLDVSITENSDTDIDVSYAGTASLGSTFSFNLDLGYNTSEVLLYEYGETEATFGFYNTNFADASTRFFMPLLKWYENNNIRYVHFAQMEILRRVDSRYFIIPTIFGDATVNEDMPISGQREMTIGSIGYYHGQDSSGTAQLAIVGKGTLNVDHSNNTLSGEIVFDEFIEFEQFVAGNGANGLYTTIDDQTLTISNGQIVGNEFTADVVVGEEGVGRLTGKFFGWDGREVGASLVLFDGDGESTDDYFAFSASIIGIW